MAVFAIYDFEIKKISRESEIQFPEYAPQEISSEQSELFHDILKDREVDFFRIPSSGKTKKLDEDPSFEKFRYEVLAHYSDIILLQVENNKTKTTIVDKQKKDNPHNPFCNVIVDYRPEQHLLAIERSPAFDNNPDKLKFIIEKAINSLFVQLGYRISFILLVQKDLKFWDAVTEIRRRNNDRVKRVTLDFHNSPSDSDNNYNTSSFCSALTRLAQKANANGYSALDAGENGEVDIDAIQEDLVNLADICYRQKEYDLTVHFQSYGIYKYGADVKAQFGVNDKALENFAGHADEAELFERNHQNSLSDWLEYTKTLLTNNYVNTEPTDIQPKRGHRR